MVGRNQATVVGKLHDSLSGPRGSDNGAWYEAVDRVRPRTLYLAQRHIGTNEADRVRLRMGGKHDDRSPHTP
jgi:hypothetical protein